MINFNPGITPRFRNCGPDDIVRRRHATSCFEGCSIVFYRSPITAKKERIAFSSDYRFRCTSAANCKQLSSASPIEFRYQKIFEYISVTREDTMPIKQNNKIAEISALIGIAYLYFQASQHHGYPVQYQQRTNMNKKLGSRLFAFHVGYSSDACSV